MQVYSEKTFGNKVKVSVIESGDCGYKLIITSSTKDTPMSLVRWHGKIYGTHAGAIRRAKSLVMGFDR